MTIPSGHLVAPVTLVDLPANPATPGGNPGENFPAGPDRDGSWVPGLPFQVRFVMKEMNLDLSTKGYVTSILITIGFSRLFFVRNPSHSLQRKCGTRQFWRFENELQHFENEFQLFENEFHCC